MDAASIKTGDLDALVAEDFDCPALRREVLGVFEVARAGGFRVLHEGRNRILAMPFTADGTSRLFAVKLFNCRSTARFLMSPFRQSRAFKAFNMAEALRKAGVGTPDPVAAVERREMGFVTDACYISALVEPCRTLRGIVQDESLSGPFKRACTAAATALVRRMHDAGMYHDDLTVGNFLIEGADETSPQVSLVDLNRASFVHSGQPGWPRRLKDLSRMRVCACRPLLEKPWLPFCDLPEGCERLFLLDSYCRNEFEKSEHIKAHRRAVKIAKFKNYLEVRLKFRKKRKG